MFDVLYIFYTYGNRAVHLFFCLSGFIFFWLYAKRVSEKTITLRSFSVLRLSRLYPLHFATLICVALGQLAYTSATSTSFVYSFNDLYHFFLNLFFASSWGLEKGFSFNGPVWSVSVEILLYAAFFIFCRIFHRNLIALFLAVIAGHFIVSLINTTIAGGVEFFFLGGILYILYEKIVTGGDEWKVTIWLPCVSVLTWVLAILSGSPNHGLIFGEPHWIVQKIVSLWAVFMLFPMTIMSLALLETKRGTLGKRMSFLGDISYSSYLIHFPLQLLVTAVTAKLAVSQELFYSPWFMASFLCMLILASLASHRYFELPMQRILRLQLDPSVNTAHTR